MFRSQLLLLFAECDALHRWLIGIEFNNLPGIFVHAEISDHPVAKRGCRSTLCRQNLEKIENARTVMVPGFQSITEISPPICLASSAWGRKFIDFRASVLDRRVAEQTLWHCATCGITIAKQIARVCKIVRARRALISSPFFEPTDIEESPGAPLNPSFGLSGMSHC